MAIDTAAEDLQDQLEEQQSSGGYDSTQMQIDQMLSAGWPQPGEQQASAALSPYAQAAPAAPYQPPAQLPQYSYQAPVPGAPPAQALAGARVPYQYQARPTTPPPPLPAPAFMQPQQPPPGAVGVVTNIPGVDRAYQMSPEETAAGAGQAVTFEPKDESGFWATEGKALGRGIASAVQSIVPYVTQTVSSVAGGLATMVEQGIGGAGTQTDPNSPSRFLDPSMPFGTEGQQVTPTGPSKVAEVEKNVYTAVTNKASEIGDWVNTQLPPTIKSYADIKSGGDALTYALERVTEMVPQLAVFAAAPGAGQGALAASLPFAAIGALYGFDKANRETNGDHNAIAESMLANAALMGAPPALLASTAGKDLIRNIATAGGINAILGAAGAAQNQTPQAIAQAKSLGGFFDNIGAMDWKQLAEGAVTGAVQGVLIGGAGTYLHPGEAKPTDTSTRDVTKVIPGNPADVDQQAALNQAINPSQPSTTSDTFKTAGAAPPAMALNPTLPGLPATAADRGIGQPPPPPPPPPGAPLVRGPADLAAQAATIEQARQQAAGTEGNVIPGAPAPAPPAPPAPPPPPMGARQIPEQPGMPGATQAGLPGVEPPPVQPELPLQPGSRLPPQAAPDATAAAQAGLPLGDQPQLPFGRAVPEVPITPTEAPPRPVEGVPAGARQGELPGVEPAPPQGELPLRQPPDRATARGELPTVGSEAGPAGAAGLEGAAAAEAVKRRAFREYQEDGQTSPELETAVNSSTLGEQTVVYRGHGRGHAEASEGLTSTSTDLAAAKDLGETHYLPSDKGPREIAKIVVDPDAPAVKVDRRATGTDLYDDEGEVLLGKGRLIRDDSVPVEIDGDHRITTYRFSKEPGAERALTPAPKPETAAEKAAAVSPKEAAAQAKARGEPVGVALVTREQLRKKLGITPERGSVAVAEGEAPEFKTVEEGNVAPTKRSSRMAQEVRAARTAEPAGRARDIPDESTGKKEAPSSDYKSIYRSRAKEIAGGTNFVDQVMRELPQAGTRGPQRPSFVKYLHDELVKARDDNTIPDLQAKQERARTPEARGRIEDDIQFYKDLREHQAEIQQQIGESLTPRPEGAAALKSAEDELDAELARIKAAKSETHNAPPSPERQVANRFSTPGVNEPLEAIYNRIEASGTAEGATREQASTSLHEVLDAITDNSKLSTAGLHHTRALAAILKKIIPASTRVIHEDAAHLFGLERSIDGPSYYDPATDTVVVGRYGGGGVETALHEAVHAATAHYIDAAVKARSEGRATPEQARHLDALEAIRKEVADIMMRDSAMTDMEMAHSLYATTDFHELTATLLTSAHVQDVLARSTPSSEFQRTMERLGYNKEERATPWSAFRGFLRRAFGLTSSTDNVLGHAMRALGDVTDAGARYRRDPAILRGIQDARLRSAVELGGHVLSAPPLSERARDMVTEQVAKMRGDRAITLRRTLLNGDNVDAIYRGYGQLFHDPDTGSNSFADYRAATERGTAVSHAVRTGRGTEGEPSLLDRWQNIDASLSRLAPVQEKALAQLTNEVGYADASVGSSDPTANAHLTKAEDLQTLQGLQARWNELPDELKRLYKERQAFHETMYRNERAGQLDQAMRLAAPESTPEDRAAAQQQFYSRASTKEFLDNPDASPLAEAMGDSYQRSRKVVQMIGQLMQMSRVQGDYAPLRRYGDYVVKWGDRGNPGEYGVRFFESMVDAEKARAKLAADGEEPSQVFSKADRRGLQQVNPRELGALEQELLKNGRTAEDAAAVRDVFATMILKRMSDSQASRLGARREGVLGASEDLRRIDRSEFDNHAMHMAMLASRVDREEALTRMQARADELRSPLLGKPGENIQAQDVVDQMRKRLPTDNRSRGLSGATAGVIGRHASNFAFLNTLFRPARMPIELVGMHAMNQSMLGGTYGQAAALRATTRAQGDVGFGKSLRLGMNNVLNQMGGNLKKVNWENGAAIRDRMIANGVNPEVANKLYDRMVAAGIIDISHAQVAAEMGRLTSKWSRMASLHDRIIGGMSQMDNAIETMARMTFAKSALDLELARNGGNLDAALDVAMEHARAVMPNWNTHNAPWLASTQGPLGALAKPLFQFRGFGLHAFGLMANLAREAYRGGDAGQRAIALKQLGGIIAYHALVGGAAIPLVEEIAKGLLGAVDFVQGRRQPRDMDRIIRTFLSDQLGPTAAMAVTRGLPSLAGIDVSSNLSLNNLMMVPEFKDLSAGELMKTAALMFVPVSGQDATQLMTGFQQALRGNITGGIRNMIPIRMVRDVATAYQWGQEGMTDSRGRVVLPSSQISTGDLIAKGIGFRPTIDSNFQAGRATITEYLNEEKDERTRIINQAVASGNVGSVAAAVSKFNRDYPANPIKYDTLLKAQQEARQSVGATYGMRVSPKQVQDVRQQTRFLPQ